MAAIKYILVPEDMYKGLLSAPSEQHFDKVNLNFAKKNLDKTKKQNKLSPSTKNILYNQELRRYLTLRKEEDEKPIKVELKNGAKIITKDFSTIRNTAGLASLPNGRSAPIPSGRSNQTNASDNKNSNPKFNFSAKSKSFTPIFNTHSMITSTPIRTSKPTTSGLLFTGDPETDEIVIDSRQPPNESILQSPQMDRVEQMMRLIEENPDKFQVSNNGAILKGGKAIKKSNVKLSVDRILNKGIHNMPSPPGTGFLEKRILKDPDAFNILNSTPPPKIRTILGQNRSSLFKQTQQGKGHHSIKSKKIIQKRAASKFTPKLWI